MMCSVQGELRHLQNFVIFNERSAKAAELTQRGESFANVTLAAVPLPPLRVAERLRRCALPVCERRFLQRSYYEA